MGHYKSGRKSARIPRRVWLLLVLLVGLSIAGVVVARHVYTLDLRAVSSSQNTQVITIQKGATVKQISAQLENDHLIRSAWAFQLYVKHKELSDRLQAGTYALSPSQSTGQIVYIMTQGKIAVRLVTILPGRRIDQVRADLINAGFTPTDVDRALDPAQYAGLPALAYKPPSVHTLEGLLWPDSYQKEPDTDPSLLIRESLVAMGQHLTPDVQAAFAAHGLTTYQGLALASIVIQEVNKPQDRTQAAQVFLLRLKAGMMLGSDVTARYGAVTAGLPPNLTYDSPYNTLLHTGLPPTPISTISSNTLDAAAHPSATNWLFFVTGDDGNTYFSATLQEHQTLTAKYCHKLCGN